MKPQKLIFIVILAFFAATFVYSMTGSTDYDQDEVKQKAMSRSQMDKIQWENQRKAKKQHDSAMKAHMKHQTKAVRKRMKKDLKKANDYNSDVY